MVVMEYLLTFECVNEIHERHERNTKLRFCNICNIRNVIFDRPLVIYVERACLVVVTLLTAWVLPPPTFGESL